MKHAAVIADAVALIAIAGACSKPAAPPAEHGAYGDGHERSTELVIPRPHVPNARRQTQHPLHPTAQSPRGGDPGLPDRHWREDVIDQVSRSIGHAAATTARTEATTLA